MRGGNFNAQSEGRSGGAELKSKRAEGKRRKGCSIYILGGRRTVGPKVKVQIAENFKFQISDFREATNNHGALPRGRYGRGWKVAAGRLAAFSR